MIIILSMTKLKLTNNLSKYILIQIKFIYKQKF